MSNYYRSIIPVIMLRTIFTLLISVVAFSGLWAQSGTCTPGSVVNGNNDPWSEECYLNNSCGLQGNPCTANDVNMLGTYLADATGGPLPIFSPGDTVTVYLWGTFQNGTSTDRYAVRTTTEMYLDGVFQSELNDCSFDILQPGTFDAVLLGPIQYVYGQVITLENTWVAWETSAAQCTNSALPDYNWRCGQYASSKCSRELSTIYTVVPNFTWECGSFTAGSREVCFSETTMGGATPYSFAWDFDYAGATSTSANPCYTYNTTTGAYDVILTVSDQNGVSASARLLVDLDNLVCPCTVSTTPQLSFNTTNVSCGANCDGAIDMTITSGVGPFNILWSTGATTEDVSGLCTGIYTVTVDGVYNCEAIDTIEITVDPDSLTLVVDDVQNVNCAGTSTGAISTTASGGSTPYTYTWSNTATTDDVSGLAPGTYSLTVTDAKGCSAQITATITQPDTLSTSLDVDHISCNGWNDGEIDLTVEGGTSPYTYAWSNGATVEDITGLMKGVYVVTVTDANGCTSIDTAGIIQLDSLEILIDTTFNVLCNGGSGGVAVLVVGGGNPICNPTIPTPTATCGGGTALTGSGNINISSGKYYVPNGNTFTGNINMSGGELVICGTLSPSNFSTTGGNITVLSGGSIQYGVINLQPSVTITNYGSIHISGNITGGGKLYNYADLMVSGDLDMNGPASEFINMGVARISNNLNNSGYTRNEGTIYVSNSLQNNGGGDFDNFCSIFVSANFLNNSTFQNYGSVNVGVTTYLNGTSTLAMVAGSKFTTNDLFHNANMAGSTGGCAAFNVEGTTTINGSGVTSGNISFCDANGIETNTGVFTGGAGINCDCDANGTGNGEYIITWSNGGDEQVNTGLTAGEYTVTVTDGSGCTATESVVITEPSAFTYSFNATPALCNGEASGSIDLTVTGATPPYTFVWSNGALTEDLTGVLAGSYVVTVTDANGCEVSDTSIVTEPSEGLSIIVDSTENISCKGFADGEVYTTASGGTAPYTYAWSPSGSTSDDRSGLTAGAYTVTVTDANGCTASTTATLSEPSDDLAIVVDSTENISCKGFADGEIYTTTSGGTAPYTYAWSPSGSTSDDRSGLTAGAYTVTVTDANGCTASTTATLSEPSDDLAIVVDSTENISCKGFADGEVYTTASGGTAPYTYAWSPSGSTSDDRSGLTAGAYTVTVTDANGCTASTTATLSEPSDDLAIVVDSTENISCKGFADGEVYTTASGGTAPYTYAWSPSGSTSDDRSGLTAGAYTVTVTDANGCTASTTATLSEPSDDLSIVVDSTENISCKGFADGEVYTTASGGTAPYTYAWSPSGSTSDDRSGLTAGAYTVTVTDANGCTASTTATLSEPSDDLAIVVDSTENISCKGFADGEVYTTASGGTAPYTYAWSPSGSTSDDRSGLTAGAYTVTVTDANGCTASTTATLSEPSDDLAIVVDSTENISCKGFADGEVYTTASGGTAPYTYAWSPSGSTSDDRSGLTAGAYTVTVTDANGCTASTTATLSEPSDDLAIVVDSTENISCKGFADGEVYTTASGGTAPYTYAWSPSGSTSDDRSGLTAGAYTVTVTDANGCTASTSATLSEPNTLVVSLDSTTNASCNGFADGALYVSVTGGTSPYTYIWTGGGATQDTTGLLAGTYTVTVTDAQGCTITGTYSVTEPNTLVATTDSVTNVACNGGTNGAAYVSVTGGTSPYTYAWTGGGATQDTTGLAAGIYTVTVTDVQGCTTTTTATISEAGDLVVTLVSTTDVSCNGFANGAIDINVTGGTQPYTYAWTGGGTSQDTTGLLAGTYTVTVSDANGCSTSGTYTITEPNTLVATLDSTTDVSCNGFADGAAYISVTGGTSPYTYAWTGGGASQDTTGLLAGTYTVTVTDAQGCTATASATITEPNTLVASVDSTDDASCNGFADGAIYISVTGGTQPYSYAWTGGGASQDTTGLLAGTYTVTVTDAQGCTATASATITEPNTLVATVDSTKNISCKGFADGAVYISVTGGTTPYTYTWTGGGATQDTTGLLAGTYTVTVTDAQGCTTTATATLTEPSDDLSIVVDSTENISCKGFADGEIYTTASGGTAPYTYAWTGGGATQDTIGLLAGTYTVTVTDANGCTASTTATLSEPSDDLSIVVDSTENISCKGFADGEIYTTASGGTAPYTYAWTGGGATQDTTGLLAGTYTVTVTDANGCTASTTATLTEPSDDLSIVVDSTENISCKGFADGEIYTTTSGGTAPYTYTWTGGGATQDTTGLLAGAYTVTVTDANGCTASATATLTEPSDDLTIVVDSTDNVSCNGFADGAVYTTASGGTAPYTYTWTGGGATQDTSGLLVGTYSVTVTDANGCTASTSTTLTEPNTLVVSLDSTTNASCNGFADGALYISVTGGTSPYTYTWTGGGATQDTAGLLAGTYSVTVSDAQGCTTSGTYTVTEPNTLIAVVDSTDDASCNGFANGGAYITVTGGTQPYTYAWTGGGATQDTIGLIQGVYTVTVTDAQGCTTTATANVTEPNALAISLDSVTNVSCNGFADGAINITTSGGTTPYTYAWTGGGATEDTSGLLAGTYTVTVTDGQGCTTSGTYTVTEPNTLVATLDSITDVSCNGFADGAAYVSVTGGTTPYTYAWTGGGATEDTTGLLAGTYTVTVTDAQGCTTTATATITEPNTLVATLDSTTDVSCNGFANGAAYISVTGGTTPYTYAWTGGGASQDTTGLLAGTYTVTVTDAQGCTTSATATITEPNTLVATLDSTTDASCNGFADGAAYISVTGGTTPYTYAWTGGGATQDTTGLLAGTYTVTVTDAQGCTTTATATITEPNTLVATLDSTTDASCNGFADGAAYISVTGGTTPYTYAWTGGGATQDTTGLLAGTYTVTVTDAQGCTTTATATITEPNTLVATLDSTTDASCSGFADGAAYISVTGGTTPYTYAWTGGGATQDTTGLLAGTYTVTVTDAQGCTTTATAVIDQPNTLVVTLDSTTDVSCNGLADGGIDITVTGGTTPYTYTWTGGGATEDTSGLLAGTYGVTVTDAQGCSTTGSYTVTEPDVLTLNNTKVDVQCAGGSDGSIDLTVTGGTTPYTYLWSNTETTQDLTGLAEGIYTVTVVDANGCEDQMTIGINTITTLLLNTASTNATCGDTNGVVSVSVSGGSAPYTYSWSNAAGNVSQQSGLLPGTYRVTVTEAGGCTATTSIVVDNTSGLTITPDVTDVVCGGNSVGSIDLTVTGGTAPYVYLWGTTQTTSSITNLRAGFYSVTVTDTTTGCSAVANIEVEENSPVSLTTATVDENCGQEDGSASVAATGGVAPYTYLWSNGSTNDSIFDLSVGVYFVTVTDDAGCTATTSVAVGSAGGPSITIDEVVDLTCSGQATGSIDISVNGGTSPYTYIWSNGSTDQDLSNLLSGPYAVTVTDANGCAASTVVTVGTPDAIFTFADRTDVSCNGAADGAIDVTVTGGAAPYTYLWSNTETTEDLTGLSGGTYTITVTDANGCTVATPVEIHEPDVLDLSFTTVDVQCAGGADGSIDLTVTGGTTPYTYLWSNTDTTEDISGLTEGIYSVTVIDDNGCEDQLTISINTTTTLVLHEASTNATCGDANGVATVTPSGGSAPYTYAWAGGVGGNTPQLTGLSAGTYTVTVTEAGGCTATTTVVVGNTSGLTITPDVTDVICGGNSVGSIDLTVTGGNAPYVYLWSTTQTTSSITNLRAGIYNVTVTDTTTGCRTVASIEVEENSPVTLTPSSISETCGQEDGGASVAATGGVAPYTYLWSTGSTNDTIFDLSAGIYFVTVTDDAGCTATTLVAVGSTGGPSITVDNVQDLTCATQASGSVSITVSGGTGPYTYVWSNGARTEDISGLLSGPYAVTVTDANGCASSTLVTVGTPNEIVVFADRTDVSCNEASDGAIDITVIGGTAPYTYAWSGGSTAQDTSGLSGGTYTVTVTDANGCTVATPVEIHEPDELTLSTQATDVLCYGGTDGAIDLTVTGGTAPYTYYWSNTDTTEDLTGLGEGLYTVYVTDANGCSTSTTVNIQTLNHLILNTATTNSGCNETNGVATVSPSGGSAPYIYEWSNGDSTATTDSLAAGAYTVTVTDVNGCSAEASVNIIGPAPISVNITSTDATCGQDNGTAIVIIGGLVANPGIEWSTGDMNVTAITGLAPGSYSVTVTDPNGCSEVITTSVGSSSDMELTFTPTDATCGASNGAVGTVVTGGTAPYTFLWSTGDTTGSITGLPAGNYGLTVTDANGCTVADNASIDNLNGPSITVDEVNDVTCIGGSTGSVAITVTGGSGAYTYYWSNTATTEDLTGLVAGTYALTVTDTNGCAANVVVTVGTSTPIVGTAGYAHVTCNGAEDGAIDLTVTGGTAPYTYLWSNTEVTEDISGLDVGTYTVTITDANGCSATTPVIITQPDVLTLSAEATDVACAGGSDGSIDLTVTGGTTDYSYLWSTGDTTEDLTGLDAGIYIVYVTDANGCTDDLTVTVGSTNELVLNTAVTNATCGTSNGSATINVTGGTGPYTYSWSNSGSTATIDNLSAGVYTVTVTDDNGCTATTNVEVDATSDIDIAVSSTDATCGNTNSGSITLTVTGGATPYIYSWSNTTANTPDQTGLAAGIYNVTVTDVNGCSKVRSIEIEEQSGITATATATESGCSTENGSASLNVSGGATPYTIVWSNGATGNSVSDLAPGLYGYNVTDANGCTTSGFVAVGSVDGPSATLAVTDLTCGSNSTGAIDLTVQQTNLTYLWSNGDTTEDVSGLTAGDYSVTVTDGNCTTVLTATVSAPEALDFEADRTDVDCNGAGTGEIDVTVNAGLSPYTYAWSNTEVTQDVTGLSVGFYTVTVTDASGCEAYTTIEISQPDVLVATVVSTDSVSCNGLADGAIDVDVTGGTTPYSYEWSGGSFGQDTTGVAAGTYTLTVTDAQGCTATVSATVGQPDTLSLSVVLNDSVSCNGLSDGSIVVNAAGGTTPYDYEWSIPGATGDSVGGLSAGDYWVIATDFNGCSTDTTYVTISEPDTIAATYTVTGVSCNSEGDGTITIDVVTGGTAPYTYEWSEPGTTNTLTGLSGGTYTVTITDVNFCTEELTITVGEPDSLDLSTSVVGFTSCPGDQDGSIDLEVLGGTAPFTYTWSNQDTTQDLTEQFEGTYSVTVVDANGCSIEGTYTIGSGTCNNPPVAVNDTVQTREGTPIDIPVVDNDFDPDGDNIFVTGIRTPATNGTTTLNSDQTITYTPDDGFVGVDSFTYVLCDDGIPSLCDTATVIIIVLPDRPNIKIPNGFSPNGDGINDNWEVVDITDFPDNKLIIFNRWGNEVYSAQPYQNDWNGRNNDGEPLPDGTYFYILDVNDGQGTAPYTGYVVIHRGR